MACDRVVLTVLQLEHVLTGAYDYWTTIFVWKNVCGRLQTETPHPAKNVLKP